MPLTTVQKVSPLLKPYVKLRAVVVVGACAAAWHWVARVRGLWLARGRCEIGVVWVEVLGIVGMAVVVGRGWGGGKCGSAAAWRSAAVDRLRVGLGVVWLRGAGVRVLAAGRGLVGDSVCGAGASILRWTCNRGVCCLQRVRRPSPTSCFAGRCGRFLGAGPVF